MRLSHLFKSISVALCLALLAACSGVSDTVDNTNKSEIQNTQPTANADSKVNDPLAARAQKVEIIRDDFGVPHIYAKTDADAVFGLLYAQAEDDFKRIERNYIWAIGRLAEVKGEEALYSDLRARLFMTTDEAKAAYSQAPDWLKTLCIAFADGLNYYLQTHPQVKPDLITHFEPWMPMYFFEGSIGGDIEQIPLPGIKAFYSQPQLPLTVASAKNLSISNNKSKTNRIKIVDANTATTQAIFSEPAGSNGFAIGGKLTKSGNPMLLINPHTSFYFRGEVHVVSEEGLNAYGAVTWGQFFVYQGFNEYNGWMHTSTYADFKDEFVEKVFEKNDELVYQYGEEVRPVMTNSVTLKYKEGESFKEKTFPMYRTHHGPITHKINNQWVATKINWKPVKALSQSYLRMKTKNHDEFNDMMNIRTNSSNNTVYADNSGNIAYYHGNFMPKRDTQFDYSQPVDGANPATDWQGLHSIEETITLLNPQNGWLQNCNSTPFTAALKFSPKAADYPAYMAPEPDNFRGIHAVQVLSKQKDITLDKLIDLAYDPHLPAFELLIPGLVKAYDAAPKKHQKLKAAIEILRAWDYRVSVDSVAMSLAHFYGKNYLAKKSYPDNLTFVQRVEYIANRSPMDERLTMFTQTLDQLSADFGSWNTPWGEINRFQRLNGDIESTFDDNQPSLPVGLASGTWGALGSFGTKSNQGTKRIYGARGNSFIAVVEFGDKVKAKTLLAGGQSGDPKSKHFDDQALMYTNRQFKDAAIYREDVEKRAVKKYKPGEL